MTDSRKNKWLGIGILLGFLAVLGVIMSRILKKKSDGMSRTPPGSLGLPVVGETLSYVKNPHRFFESRVAKHGPVFKTRLLGSEVVCFTGPDAFTFFSNSSDLDRHGANPGHIQELLCLRSLPLIDGPDHFRMRGLVLQAFQPEVLESYVSIVEKTTDAFLRKWERQGDFAWVTEYKKMSASTCAALFLGADPGAEDDGLVATLEDFMAGLTSLPLNLPWSAYGKALRGRDELLRRIDIAISSHRSNPRSDLLSEMLGASTGDGSRLSEEQLRAQMVHMFFAAYGGIFRVLTLMCMSFGQNQDVMQRARQEVSEHTPEGEITLQSLEPLTYLDQVTREVRRHNRIFASTFFDWVASPMKYEGYDIPIGWKATGGIYTTMQDEEVFECPAHFDPDRFGSDRAEDFHKPNSYIPQGGGPMEGHRCPAEDLTTLLMKAVGVLLLRNFTWELPPQNLELDHEPSPLPRDGLRVHFSRVGSAVRAEAY